MGDTTRNMERALELDPRNLFILQQLTLTYMTQHRYEDAIRIYDRTLTAFPGDPLTRISRALVARYDARAGRHASVVVPVAKHAARQPAEPRGDGGLMRIEPMQTVPMRIQPMRIQPISSRPT